MERSLGNGNPGGRAKIPNKKRIGREDREISKAPRFQKPKGSPEEKALLQRYTNELDSQEDRLATLHGEIGDLKTKRQQAGTNLDQRVSTIE